MSHIHSTAQISAKAQIDDAVTIGAYCVVEEGVRLHKGVTLHPHVVIMGQSTIKHDTTIYPFAVIGAPPQDLKYKGEASQLTIGAHCHIREHVTIHPGTASGRMETSIGDDCLLMVGSHVAHDCHLGDHVILANNATLAGHVTVGTRAVIGGLAAIHQHIHIGDYAMISGTSGVRAHVIPFGMVLGSPAVLIGLNLVGLRRSTIQKEAMMPLRHAYKELFVTHAHDQSLNERMATVQKKYGDNPLVADMCAFITKMQQGQKTARHGICQSEAAA